METEYEPSFVHQEAAERSAQILQIDTSKHVITVAICAVVCGLCLAFSMVSCLVAWNASTDAQISRNRLVSLQAQHDELVARVTRDEGDLHALRRE